MAMNERTGNWGTRVAGLVGVASLAIMAAMPLACGSAPVNDEVENTGVVAQAVIPPCPQPVTSYQQCRTPYGSQVFGIDGSGTTCVFAASPNQNDCWFGTHLAKGQFEGTCAGCRGSNGEPWTTTRGEWLAQDPVPSNLQIAAHPNSYGTYGYYDPLSGFGQWNFYTRDWSIFGSYNSGTIYQTDTITTAYMTGGLVTSGVSTVSAQGNWSIAVSSFNITTVVHFPPDTTDYSRTYTYKFSGDDNYLTLTPTPANGARTFTFRRQ